MVIIYFRVFCFKLVDLYSNNKQKTVTFLVDSSYLKKNYFFSVNLIEHSNSTVTVSSSNLSVGPYQEVRHLSFYYEDVQKNTVVFSPNLSPLDNEKAERSLNPISYPE